MVERLIKGYFDFLYCPVDNWIVSQMVECHVLSNKSYFLHFVEGDPSFLLINPNNRMLYIRILRYYSFHYSYWLVLKIIGYGWTTYK